MVYKIKGLSVISIPVLIQISSGKFTFSLGLLDESPDIDRVIGLEANQAPAKK